MSKATRQVIEGLQANSELESSQGAGLAGTDKPLSTAIERIRLRGWRRVLWQRHLWERTAQLPAQGLAIPHEEIDIVCQDLDNRHDEADFFRSDPRAQKLSERIAELEAVLPAGGPGRLGELTKRFGLSSVESDFMLLCAAPELDPRLRRLYGYLHDDASVCAPTVWLAATLFEWEPSEGPTPQSPLVQWLLAYPLPNEEQPWSSLARWAADPRIVGFLTGSTAVAPSLQPAGQWIEAHGEPAYEPPAAAQLNRLLENVGSPLAQESPRLAQLIGPEGVGRRGWAARVCAGHGLRLLGLDAPRLLGGAENGKAEIAQPGILERLVRAQREALLQDCALYWDRADRVPPEIWGEAPLTASAQFFGVERAIQLPAGAPYCEPIPFALPTPLEAQALWRQALPEELEELGIHALAERFTLTPAEIRTLAPKAGEGRETLWAACRSLSHGRLGRLATLLPCPFGWDDIVLPKDTKDHLKEIAAQAANRTTVYDEWGFGRQRPLGRGITALFAGPSGTGKTMAAQVLAAEMGVVLFRIDLASVVSKYVGETEKNLRQIFDEAERLNAVLFFDEADALFGKRTQVKDAHDRYANIEINYLLQRMESYEGLAILATNRRGDIDSAFLRRLRFIIEFPMPGIKERAAIWRLALPERAPDGTPLLDRIDWELLARKLEITGAAIKDIALGAAFTACGEGSTIGMRHIVQAAQRELMKGGKFVDFGYLHSYESV